MKRATVRSFVWFLMSLALLSCNLNKGERKKPITGEPNQVVIVIGKELWKGDMGSLMQSILARPQSSLPQSEPVFSLVNIPPEAFINLFKTHRNIITVKISSAFTESKIAFTHDTWAFPQAVVNIQASSNETFNELFTANGEKIISFFIAAEKDRLKEPNPGSRKK